MLCKSKFEDYSKHIESDEHNLNINKHLGVYSKIEDHFNNNRKFTDSNGLITLAKDKDDVVVKINKKLLKNNSDDVVLIIDKKNYTLKIDDNHSAETNCDSVEKLLKKKRGRHGKKNM